MNAPPHDLIAAFAFPTSPELVDAIPFIISLIIIEGLRSVDNALAMASHLPGKQKYQSLKWGIIGAYLFRGLCLAFAACLIENPWLKICGAAYLIYLISEHFTSAGDERAAHEPSRLRAWSGSHFSSRAAVGRCLNRSA